MYDVEAQSQQSSSVCISYAFTLTTLDQIFIRLNVLKLLMYLLMIRISGSCHPLISKFLLLNYKLTIITATKRQDVI